MKGLFILLLSLLISTTVSYAAYYKYPKGSIYGYEYRMDHLADKVIKNATGADGQLTFDDYQKSVDNLTIREQKRFENTKQDFAKMDYNSDGLVSIDEFKLYNRIEEQNRKKTKKQERRIKIQKGKDTYKDPQIEIDELKRKIEEATKK